MFARVSSFLVYEANVWPSGPTDCATELAIMPIIGAAFGST